MPSRVLQDAFKRPPLPSWEAPKSLQGGARWRLRSKIYNSYLPVHSTQVTLPNSQCTDHNSEAILHRSLFAFHPSMFLVQSALWGVYRPQFSVRNLLFTIHKPDLTVRWSQILGTSKWVADIYASNEAFNNDSQGRRSEFQPFPNPNFPTERLRSNKNRVTQFTIPSDNEQSRSSIYGS